jgi:hypothetical protein
MVADVDGATAAGAAKAMSSALARARRAMGEDIGMEGVL